MRKIFLIFALVTLIFTLTSCDSLPQSRVSFIDGEGFEYSSVTLNLWEKIEAPADPVRDGYKFIGWYEGDIKYEFGSYVFGNKTLVAGWEKLPEVIPEYYTVTFTADNGMEPIVVKVKPGDCVDIPDFIPEKEGHYFHKWYIAGDVYDFSTPVTSDITIVATWGVCAPDDVS